MQNAATGNSQDHPPTLHFFCGKIAAGKSTLSRRLAADSGAVLLCEDIWLSRLYADDIRTFEDYLKYAARLKSAIGPHVIGLLQHGQSVVLDFPGNVPSQRAWFRELFEAAQVDHVLHFLDKPDALCRAQMHQRNREMPEGAKPLSDAEYDHITAYFVAPTEAEQFTIKHYPQN
jgi:predicted kinase